MNILVAGILLIICLSWAGETTVKSILEGEIRRINIGGKKTRNLQSAADKARTRLQTSWNRVSKGMGELKDLVSVELNEENGLVAFRKDLSDGLTTCLKIGRVRLETEAVDECFQMVIQPIVHRAIQELSPKLKPNLKAFFTEHPSLIKDVSDLTDTLRNSMKKSSQYQGTCTTLEYVNFLQGLLEQQPAITKDQVIKQISDHIRATAMPAIKEDSLEASIHEIDRFQEECDQFVNFMTAANQEEAAGRPGKLEDERFEDEMKRLIKEFLFREASDQDWSERIKDVGQFMAKHPDHPITNAAYALELGAVAFLLGRMRTSKYQGILRFTQALANFDYAIILAKSLALAVKKASHTSDMIVLKSKIFREVYNSPAYIPSKEAIGESGSIGAGKTEDELVESAALQESSKSAKQADPPSSTPLTDAKIPSGFGPLAVSASFLTSLAILILSVVAWCYRARIEARIRRLFSRKQR